MTLQELLIQVFVVGFLKVDSIYAMIFVPFLLHVTNLLGDIFQIFYYIIKRLLIEHYHIVLEYIYNLLEYVKIKYHIQIRIQMKLFVKFLIIY